MCDPQSFFKFNDCCQRSQNEQKDVILPYEVKTIFHRNKSKFPRILLDCVHPVKMHVGSSALHGILAKNVISAYHEEEAVTLVHFEKLLRRCIPDFFWRLLNLRKTKLFQDRQIR